MASYLDFSVLEGVLRHLRDHPDAFGQLAFAAAAYVLSARAADAGSAARRSIQFTALIWGRGDGRLFCVSAATLSTIAVFGCAEEDRKLIDALPHPSSILAMERSSDHHRAKQSQSRYDRPPLVRIAVSFMLSYARTNGRLRDHLSLALISEANTAAPSR